MNVDQMLKDARDAMTVTRVFGEPIERDGTLIIPAAKVTGGGGGGADNQNNGGGGFGLSARPAGAFVVRNGDVEWQAAIDINRLALGGQILGLVALLVIGSVLRSRRR